MSNLTEKHEIIPVIMKSSNGELVVSSRVIAAGICKEHKDILKKIREILNDEEFSVSNYLSEQGKTMPEYLLPKDSFILLLMNYHGYNDFKRAYIKRFNEMEKALKEHATERVQQPVMDPAMIGAERAKIILAIANNYRDKYDGRYAQILDSYATKELTGEHILPLPELPEKYYTASEVGKMLGTNANVVGRIANKHKLKNEQYGKWFADKAKYASKEVRTFQYNNAGIDIIRTKLILKDTNQ